VISLALADFTLRSSFMESAWLTPLGAAAVVSALAVACSVGFVLFREHDARNVLHVLLDVINHFHRPSARFPTRRHIENRFEEVLDRVLNKEHPTRLTVLAHSQGTMIALEVLSQPRWHERLRIASDGLRVYLLTFGSPFTHIYQQYFPAQYPPISEARWATLKTIVDCWVNIFRIDDYVGTHIYNDGNGGLRRDDTRPANQPIAPGGHTHYWENDALSHVAKLLPGESNGNGSVEQPLD
jgi:hypothetical protein